MLSPREQRKAATFLESFVSAARTPRGRALRRSRLRWIAQHALGGVPVDAVAWHPVASENALDIVLAITGSKLTARSQRTIQTVARGMVRHALCSGRLDEESANRALEVLAVPIRESGMTQWGRFIPVDVRQRLWAALEARPLERAVYAALLLTGARCCELERLTLLDADSRDADGGILLRVVDAFTGDIRYVPLSRDGTEALRAWLAVRPRTAHGRFGHDRLFLSSWRRGKPLTREGVWGMCRRWSKLTGFHLDPRSFRLTLAKQMLRSGIDSGAVAERLGLRTARATARYDLRNEAERILRSLATETSASATRLHS